jgi:hypothetical protein
MVSSAVELDMLSLLNLGPEQSPRWSTESDVGSKMGAAGLRIEEYLNWDCAVFGGTGVKSGSSPEYRDSGGGRFTLFVTAESRLKSSARATRATLSTKKGLFPFFWKGATIASSVQLSHVISVVSDPE